MKLFGTDGVRGMAGEKLTAMLAMRLAMAAGIYFRKQSITNKILVGKDTRKSGYMIENAIVSGLTAVGYDVRQIGPMPTPAIAFLTEDLRCDAGIMISASHNPYHDNGIKFFDKRGNKLNEAIEEEIEKIYFDEELISKNQARNMNVGASKRIDDVIGRYIVHIKNSLPRAMTLHGLRVVLDTANGAAYKVAPTVFTELGADVFVINDNPDGRNINESCGALHPQKLGEEVRKLRADIGFAFDGDADRIVVVDENGEIVHGDKLIGTLACHLKQQGQLSNNGIVATVMSNQGLADFLQEREIELFRCNVGDKYVLETMQKEGLNFGGEQSGHLILSDYAKTGDALAAALQVVAFVLKKGKKASEVLNPFDLYPQILENIKIKKKVPLEDIEGYKEIIEKIEKRHIRPLIRYSGTENLLRVLLEGKDTETVEQTMQELLNFFSDRLNG
ncbi:MAG: phosphoglucosamine mutase [Campylobacteraceae bacterium 4484_4]|nr:MAG: phosphoglucosamine mutase [Campylobacteraceae bacterium 4484_4]